MADNYKVLNADQDEITIGSKERSGIHTTTRYTNDGDDEAFGSKADAPATSDNGTFTYIALFKRLLQKTIVGAAFIATGQVDISNIATNIVTARATRRRITIIQDSIVDIFIGTSVESGAKLLGIPGATITIETTAEIKAICATTAKISFIEEYD